MCAAPASKPHRGPGGVSASMRPSVGSAGGSRHAGRLLHRGAAPVLLGLIQSAVATCRHHPRRPRGGPSALSERGTRAVPLLAVRLAFAAPRASSVPCCDTVAPPQASPCLCLARGARPLCGADCGSDADFQGLRILSGRRLGAAPGLVCSPSVLVPVPRPSYHWLAGSRGVHAQTPACPSQVLLPPESRHCRGLLLMAGPGRLPWLRKRASLGLLSSPSITLQGPGLLQMRQAGASRISHISLRA